jgi:hypothetical protein
MSNLTLNVEALRIELREILERHGLSTAQADVLLKSIWSDVEEAFDLALFTAEDSREDEALMEDPLANMTDVEREEYLTQRLQALDPRIATMLERSRGDWVRDE